VEPGNREELERGKAEKVHKEASWMKGIPKTPLETLSQRLNQGPWKKTKINPGGKKTGPGTP